MKKKILPVVMIVLLVLFLLALMPWGRQISVRTTAYEYALDQKEPLAEREVAIEGRYTCRLFREDVFRGTMTVSGYPETDGAIVYIQFWDDRSPGTISYQINGIPVWTTELRQIYVNRNMSRFAFQIFEVEVEDTVVHSSWIPETGRVLCADAPDYETMADICTELGLPVSERVWNP